MTEQPVVVVSGWGRSGTTMMMSMLEAGGIPTAPGADARSHEHGTAYESVAAAEPGTAIKVLDPMNPEFDDLALPESMVTIWMDRNLVHQAPSYMKFLHTIRMPIDDRQMDRIVRDWKRQMFTATRKLEQHGPLLRVSYDKTLQSPATTASAVNLLLCLDFPNLDLEAMARAVHVRGPECRPGLEFEHRGLRPSDIESRTRS